MAGIDEDINRHPSHYVCAYKACDFHHNEGWLAIKKDKSVIFYWDKKRNTTLVLLTKYVDGDFLAIRVKYDKYGIMDVGGFKGEDAIFYRDIWPLFLDPVKQCSDGSDNEYRPDRRDGSDNEEYSDKTDCPPSWKASNGKCKKGW